MEPERPALACGHQYTGQARCGLCDSCWVCCTCNRGRVVGVPVSKPRQPPTPTDKPVLLYTDQCVGRGTATVLCTCGYKNEFFIWSWAGHGKARCKGCMKWICRRTLEFVNPQK